MERLTSLPALQLQHGGNILPGSYMGPGDPNSSCNACATSTLTIERFLQA